MYSYNKFILSEFYNLFNYDTYTFYFIIYLLFYYFIALIFTAQHQKQCIFEQRHEIPNDVIHVCSGRLSQHFKP